MNKKVTEFYYKITKYEYEKIEEDVRSYRLPITIKVSGPDVNITSEQQHSYKIYSLLKRYGIKPSQEVIGNIGWKEMKKIPHKNYRVNWNGIKQFIKENLDRYSYVIFKSDNKYSMFVDSQCPVKINGELIENLQSKCYFKVSKEDLKDKDIDKQLFPNYEKELNYDEKSNIVVFSVSIEEAGKIILEFKKNKIPVLSFRTSNSPWSKVKENSRLYKIAKQNDLDDFIKMNGDKFRYYSFINNDETIVLYVQSECNIPIKGEEIKNIFPSKVYIDIARDDYEKFYNELPKEIKVRGLQRNVANLYYEYCNMEGIAKWIEEKKIPVIRTKICNTPIKCVMNARCYYVSTESMSNFIVENNENFGYCAFKNGDNFKMFVEYSCSIKIDGEEIDNKTSMKGIDEKVKNYKGTSEQNTEKQKQVNDKEMER